MDSAPNPVIVQDVEYIKISISTKGVYTWDCKVIGTDVAKIKKITDDIEKAYPQESWKNLKVGKDED